MIGKVLDRRYHIIKQLGSGSFGQTYLAKDIRRPGNPKCVVKHLRPIRNTIQSVQATRKRFHREAQTLEKLGKHDQIPLLLAYFEAKHEFCLVEEYIAGTALMNQIVPGVPWCEEAVIELLEEILEILGFVHQHQVIHRDVTPANLICRTSDHKLVLIDFGAVKEITTIPCTHAMPKTVATGTPVYMPLEQFRGYPQLNSDIYAVGMIAIQALAGVAAKELVSLKNPLQPAEENLWKQRVQISPQFSEVLEKMVQTDCRNRYQSVSEVVRDLKIMSAGSLMEELPVTSLKTAQPSTKYFLKFLIKYSHWLALVGGILVVVSVVFFLQNQTKIQAQKFYHQGNQRAGEGDLKGALSDYTQSLHFNPKNETVYLSRGDIHLQIGDIQQAVADYNKAINLNPNLAPAYTQRCYAQLQLSAYEIALSDCTKALQINPNLAAAYHHRCTILWQLEAYQRALADCTQAVQLDPQNAGVYSDRGFIRSVLRNRPGGVGDVSQALKLLENQANQQQYQLEPAFSNGSTKCNSKSSQPVCKNRE